MSERTQVEQDIMDILGYTCETQAPNSSPTTEYVTDRWMKPRRDALVEYVLTLRRQAREQLVNALTRGSAMGKVPVAVLVARLEHELDSVRFALDATTDKGHLLTKAQGLAEEIRNAI